MFIIANLLEAVAKIIDLVVTLYIFAIIGRVVLSWIQYDSNNQGVRFIHEITEPVLLKLRRVIPAFGGFDVTPMILIFGLYILEGFVVDTLNGFAMVLR